MLRLLVGALIFAGRLALIMVRPYRITEAASAAVGALLMSVCGIIAPGEAVAVLAGQWNIYGFFLGLKIISAIADAAGIFDVLAYQAARQAGGSSRRLYLAIFAVGALITALLSNDATALILTPVVYTLVTRLRLPVLPFMFARTFIADTASFVLPVSNPINVLVLNTFGSDLGTFLRYLARYLALPAPICIALNIGLFLLIFRRRLAVRHEVAAVAPPTVASSGE